MQRIDARELGKLFDKYASPLALYASRWTQSPEDCVQEAIIQLASLHVKPENPVAWLFRAVRNRALNELRSRRRRNAREQNAAKRTVSYIDPAGNISVEEDREQLNRVLDRLTSEERELVVLRIWSGLSWREIAELTEMSSSSAQRRYVASLEKMKERLEGKCLTKPE